MHTSTQTSIKSLMSRQSKKHEKKETKEHDRTFIFSCHSKTQRNAVE